MLKVEVCSPPVPQIVASTYVVAGWPSPVGHLNHNQGVAGSNPVPATVVEVPSPSLRRAAS